MEDFVSTLPFAYWVDNTLYFDEHFCDVVTQFLGDLSFFLVLISAELFALLGALLWVVFVLRGK